MNILQFLLILKAHAKLMLLTLTLSVVLVSAISVLLPKTYTSTASLVVNVRGADPVTGQAMQSQQSPGYVATQVDVIRSQNVALKVVDDLKLEQRALCDLQKCRPNNGGAAGQCFRAGLYPDQSGVQDAARQADGRLVQPAIEPVA